MRLRRFRNGSFVAIAAIALVACSSSGEPGDSIVSPIGPPAACVPGSVWKASSKSLSLTSFGFFQGSTGYDKDRSAMTPEQLTALDGMCQLPPAQAPTNPVNDAVSYHLSITDQDGTVAQYRAADMNVLDGDEGSGAAATPTIRYDTFAPFLATIHCLTASETRQYGPTSGPTWPPPANGPAFGADSACLNGVFLPYGCAQVGVNLTVEKAGEYTVRVVDGFEHLALSIFTSDGTTVLATSGPPGGDSPSVTYRFTTPGAYPVRIDKKLADGTCDANGGTAGDIGVRVSFAP
jgi:hypothetical protein